MHRPTARTPRRVKLGAVTALVALLTACAGASGPAADTATVTVTGSAATPDLTSVTLKVAYLVISSDTATRFRELSAAFDDTPYKLEWVAFDGSNGAVEALNAGAVDIGLMLQSTVSVLAQGNAKPEWTTENRAFSVIAAALPGPTSNQVLLVPTDSQVQTVADLKGKKVSYARGSLQHYFWNVAAREAGLQPGDVELVELPSAEGKAAFQSGALDAIVTGTGSARRFGGSGVARPIADSGDLPLYRVTLARRGLFDNPLVEAAVADFLLRSSALEEWKSGHVAEMTKVYEEVSLLDPEEAAFSAQDAYLRAAPLDDILVEALQDQSDIFFADQVIANKSDAQVLIDNRFEGR